MKSKADVVSNIALVVAIISLLSAGAFLLIDVYKRQVFDSDPEPPIVYDVKVSEGWLKLDCVSGDFEDFSMYRIQ